MCGRLGQTTYGSEPAIAELTALRATVAEQYVTAEAADPRSRDAEQICSYI
jgi:hypothetical protein